MDNQHKLIKGYRDLSQEEIDLMNEIKELASAVGIIVDKVCANINRQYIDAEEDEQLFSRLDIADPYTWIIAAKDELRTGFMKLTRAVAQPTTF